MRSAEWLSTATALERYPIWKTRDAVRKFVKRWAVPHKYIGRQLLIDARDLEQATKRRRPHAGNAEPSTHTNIA